jgi:hypothetical protein
MNKKVYISRFLNTALLAVGMLIVFNQATPATQVMFASTAVEQGKVCPKGNVKKEVPGNYEYNDGTGWIESGLFQARWGANSDYEIGKVCIKIGGPGGGTLVWPNAQAGSWTNPTKYGISHVVLYRGEVSPTPTLTPTPTDVPTPTLTATPVPSETPTLTPTPAGDGDPTPTLTPTATLTPTPTSEPGATSTPTPTTAPEVLGEKDQPTGKGGEILGTTDLPATGSANVIYFILGILTTFVSGYGLIKTGKQELY